MLQRWDAVNTWWNDRVVKFSYDDQLRLLQRLGFFFAGGAGAGMGFRFGTRRVATVDRLARWSYRATRTPGQTRTGVHRFV